ncbi:unnamed protein product [Parascedosporium putredinis]|uniref:Ceramide very long chain fatty acid hydroxylase n=1 Tax=Parascedosporium putredinis TaxID=1442378 RepID=A0A9P1M8E5_9PEZI|nr:unnamed protein product [Parascedosporium putredinis]CAI7988746.1 unnamed protein product [Parascedosporium putredinis]
MPSRTLPTFTRAEVEEHSTAKSCYVTIGTKVYDITDFAEDHPGGADLIYDYGGKDIEDILKDEAINGGANGSAIKPANGSAQETTAVDENGVPVHPRTGMSCEEDLSKETDFSSDYKRHKFLDLSRPLFPQVWFGGFTKEFYLDQVHRPRHYKGGESAPLFGNFLEPLSKTPWFVVPMVWLPWVGYGSYLAYQGYSNHAVFAAYWVFGFFLWSLIEYILHRFLFHLDQYLPDNRVFITLHFLLHGIHHYLPMDKYRLVMPPTLFIVLATPFWYLAHFLFFYSWHVATTVYCGGIFGYVCYDLTHYFLHHQNLPLWYKGLKKYHLEHHFLDYELGFGVTSKFWDTIFGTELTSGGKKA